MAHPVVGKELKRGVSHKSIEKCGEKIDFVSVEHMPGCNLSGKSDITVLMEVSID